MPRSNEGYLWNATSEGYSGLETDAVVSSSPLIRDTYDVVVIGAGFAGLVAGRDLAADRQLSVLLVDGRDRIGGRTWTAKAFGESFEMGGTWVHWMQPFVYAEIARYGLERNLKTSSGGFATERRFKTASGAFIIGSAAYQDIASSRIANKFFSKDGLSSRELMPYPLDPLRQPAPWTKYDHVTVKDRLDEIEDESREDKDVFEAFLRTFGGVTGGELSWTETLRWFALGGHDLERVAEFAGVYKLGNGGMTSLARLILQDYRGDVLMGTTIQEVSQERDFVSLTATNGSRVKAKQVVCTVPLNVLHGITFSPPLDPVRQEALAIGHLCKITKIHFKTAGEEAAFYSSAEGCGDSPFGFAFSDHSGTDASGQGSTYSIGFGLSERLKDCRNSDEVCSQFKKHMKPDADVLRYVAHDWTADPLAKGAWACWGPNCFSKYLQVLQRPHGRVCFASADWANGWRGFIDGAIEQGVLAARHVKRTIDNDTKSKI